MGAGGGGRGVSSSPHPPPPLLRQIDANDARANGALLTAPELAALLSVPTSWVYAEARAGRIPHVTLGRYRRFRREAIEAWINATERGPKGR